MGRAFDDWETLALGLAAGLLAQAAPALTAPAIAVALLAARPPADASTREHARALAALCAVALAGVVGGPALIVIAVLTLQTGMLVLRARAAGRLWQLAAAPTAALLYRCGAPDALTFAAVCLAIVAWMDWAIARLAGWRLGSGDAAAPFLLAQLAILAPLLSLATPGAAVAAFAAMAIAGRWRPAPRYAAA